jgi:hypothetical protein
VVDYFTPGDFNRDGNVDSADLAIWRSSEAASAAADADFDRDVDGRDLRAWQRNLNGQLPLSTIPEPHWLAYLMLGFALTFGRRIARQPSGSIDRWRHVLVKGRITVDELMEV